MRSRAIQLGAWFLVMAALSWSQVHPSDAPAGDPIPLAPEPETTPTNVPIGGAQVDPSHNLAANQPPVAPESESTAKNVLIGGVTLAGTYDTNLATTNTGQIGGFEGSVSPFITLQQQHPKWNWLLDYSPSFTRYQHYLVPNEYSHTAATEFSYSPTRRLQFSLGGNYAVTSDPFFNVAEGPSGYTPGPLVAPNVSPVLPRTQHTSVLSDAAVSYMFSPVSAAGVTGNFSKLTFQNPASDLQPYLTNTRTIVGSTYYLRQISRNQSIGAQYAYMDFNFSPGEEASARANVLVLMYGLRFGASQLTIFAGPQHWNTRSMVSSADASTSYAVRTNGWTPLAGARFEWRRRRHALLIEVIRRISDGGGLMEAVDMKSGSVSLSSRLSKKLVSNLGFSITDNKSLTAFTQPARLTSGSANAGITYEVTNSFSLGISYSRIQQTGSDYVYGYGDHNQVQLTLNYHFTHPLGR